MSAVAHPSNASPTALVRARHRRRWLGVGSIYLLVLALLALGRVLTPEFWTAGNLLQIVKDVSILGIVAVGLSFITLSGHYVDLSIPAIMACSGIVAVAALSYGFAVALLAGALTGGLLGLINGLMVGYLRLNPILWTLAAMSVFDGIARWAYGGKWIYARLETSAGAAFADLYRGEWLGAIPVTVSLFLVVAMLGDFAMRQTGFGKQLKFTGAAYEAARLSGIHVQRTVMLAFLISGLAAALGGMVKTSFNMYGDVEIGLTYDFQAITAVVIGGMTLAGGRGSVPGVVGGVLVIGLLGRILPLIPGVGQDEQFIIRGVIFIVAVGVSMLALRRSGRSDA
ncbi:MAG: ABC transporter permease [Verrucomicrobia bacterium]|nr:ABC transporter permease [Verrucomicrobiota bacterium]